MPVVHLLIKGKVQGVFFRATAKEVAESLGLKGWVKNTGAGDVECLASGNEPALQNFIDWCKQGPEKALVNSIAITEMPEQSFGGFHIVRDY